MSTLVNFLCEIWKNCVNDILCNSHAHIDNRNWLNHKNSNCKNKRNNSYRKIFIPWRLVWWFGERTRITFFFLPWSFLVVG